MNGTPISQPQNPSFRYSAGQSVFSETTPAPTKLLFHSFRQDSVLGTSGAIRPVSTPNYQLFSEAAQGNLPGVKKALQSGAEINALHLRSLKPGGEVGAFFSTTALGIGASIGHVPIVEYLVEAGANPYIPYDEDKQSPRDLALQKKFQHIANYLEAKMRSPKILNKVDDVTGFTPLTFAISNKYEEKAFHLIDLGANVCRADRHGKTPLIYAIEKNSTAIVAKLLEKGAIASGVTAVKCALELATNDILQMLINTEGLLVDAFLDDGYTMLTKAINTCNMEIAKSLLDRVTDPSKVDLKNHAPLDVALEIPLLEIAELLVSKGVPVPRTLKQGLFQKIADDGSVEVYRFLLKNGWDINQVNENGKTALALSASNEDLLASRFLIENGARMNLARDELEYFRKKNHDFDCFMKKVVAEMQPCFENGQE